MSLILHCSLAVFLIGFLVDGRICAQQPDPQPRATPQPVTVMGDWYFDRVGGPHGEVSHSKDIVKANADEAGYMFTLTKDGKFTTTQPNGTQNTSDYQYIVKRHEIILGKDTMKIKLLTSKILELYPTNGKQPSLFLRRNKDGKMGN